MPRAAIHRQLPLCLALLGASPSLALASSAPATPGRISTFLTLNSGLRQGEQVSPRRLALEVKDKARAQELAKQHGAQWIHLKHTSIYANHAVGFLQFDTPYSNAQDLVKTFDGLSAQAGVLSVSYDYPTHILEDARITPNDPMMAQLWGMKKISAPQGWDIHHDASDIVVMVIDSGIDYNHPDLAANMWKNPGEIPGNNIDDDKNGYVDDIYGIDTHNRDADPMDDNSHGTHCAGTIGAAGNNDAGVAGVAWGVKLMGCKVHGSNGSGDDSVVAECLEYMMEMKERGNNILVSNNSWGADGHVPAIQKAFEAAGEKGIIHACACGNSNVNNDTSRRPPYPASYDHPSIVSVMNSDSRDGKFSSSSYGKKTVDLAAPGAGILSTGLRGRYVKKTGTSMSCPHVAGALAVLADYTGTKDVSTLRSLILDNVDKVSALSQYCATGGRLNLEKSLKAATPKDDKEESPEDSPSDDSSSKDPSPEESPSDDASSNDPSPSEKPSESGTQDPSDKSDSPDPSESEGSEKSSPDPSEKKSPSEDTDDSPESSDLGCQVHAPASGAGMLLFALGLLARRRRASTSKHAAS